MSNFLKALLIGSLITLGLALITGCSAVKEISQAATDIRGHATDIRTDVVRAKQALANNQPDKVLSDLNTIDGRAEKIVGVTTIVLTKVTEVQDKTPWWATLIKLGLVAGILGAVVFLLWRLNGFLLIEKIGQKIADFFGWIIGAI